MTRKPNPDELMTPAEVARRIGVSPITVRSWVSKGWLKSRVTPGGHRRYLWADIENLLEKKGRSPTPTEPVKVLVIDDDTQFRSYMINALHMLMPDALLKEACDGFQAGMLIAEFRPDLILLDYAMPRINGVEVCKMIKANPAYAGARIVAVTGFADAEIHASLMKAGVDKVVLKPFVLKDIEKMLDKFQLRTVAA